MLPVPIYFIVLLCARAVQRHLVFHVINAVMGDQYIYCLGCFVMVAKSFISVGCAMVLKENETVLIVWSTPGNYAQRKKTGPKKDVRFYIAITLRQNTQKF